MVTPRRSKSHDSNGVMTSDTLGPKHKGRVYVSTMGKIRRCIILGVMGVVGLVVFYKVVSSNSQEGDPRAKSRAGSTTTLQQLQGQQSFESNPNNHISTNNDQLPSPSPTPAPTPASISTTRLQRLTIGNMPVWLQHPANMTQPNGILFVAHGCGHAATDFWPSTGDWEQQQEAAEGSGSEDEQGAESQEHHGEGPLGHLGHGRESHENNSPEGESPDDPHDRPQRQSSKEKNSAGGKQEEQQPTGNGVGGAAGLLGGQQQQQQIIKQSEAEDGDLEVGGTEITQVQDAGGGGGNANGGEGTVAQQQHIQQQQVQQQPAGAVADGDMEVGGTEMTKADGGGGEAEDEEEEEVGGTLAESGDEGQGEEEEEEDEDAQRRHMRRRLEEGEEGEDMEPEEEGEGDTRQQRLRNRDKRKQEKHANPFFQAAQAKKEAAKAQKQQQAQAHQFAKDDPHNICPECLGLPEERAIVDMARHEFGFTVVAMSSLDRNSQCWTPPDSMRVAQVLSELNQYWELHHKPIVAFGASSGGGFVGSGLVQAMLQMERPLDGYIAQIAAPNPLKMDLGPGVEVTGRTNEKRNIPPAVYIPMTRDEAMVTKVDKIVDQLKKQLNYEFAAKSIPVHSLSMTDDFFQNRIPDGMYSFEESQKMVHALLDSHILRDTYSAVTGKHKRMIRHDPRKASWRHLIRDMVHPPDKLKADHSPIAELMNVAYGMHEMTRDGVQEALQWLMEAHQEDQANQF